MPVIRRSKYLSCFYCGRRTSTLNDGHIRRFECPNCDAANYLDENGEITDPPHEATSSQSQESYAIPRASSQQQQRQSSEVFCEKCLQNQRLFTRSLAQYLPDDPDDPEYEERERGLFKFRKSLERNYPQVCAECEPKVLDRISQAGYTAKTDHLRRMIDRSRKARDVNPPGWLDLIDALGRYLWLAGFLLQGLWHLSALRELIGQSGIAFQGSRHLDVVPSQLFGLVPAPEKLAKWGITATAASLWWNPHFVKTIRGFTKHLLGISTWYTYQAVIMFVRIVALEIPNITPPKGAELSTQVAAHSFTLIFIFCILKLAPTSIRTDTTPLFASTSKRSSSLVDEASAPRSKSRDNGAMSMSEVLDEVMASSPSRHRVTLEVSPSSMREGYHTTSPLSSRLTELPYPGQQAFSSFGIPTQSFSFDPLDLSEEMQENAVSQQTPQYNEEMDWTPTQSKHRAFGSFGSPQEPLRGFGQAPVEEKHGQFWYKVPPAPTSIARRVLNPPTTARLRNQQPVTPTSRQKENLPVFGIRLDGGSFGGPGGSKDGEEEAVTFKEPSFFPEVQRNDPRNSLSDMFGQAFTISPKQERERARDGGRGGGRRTALRPVSLSDAALLLLSLPFLLLRFPEYVPPEYGSHLRLGICCLALVIWARVVNDTVVDYEAATKLWSRPLTSAVGPTLAIAELLLAFRAASCVWVGRGFEALPTDAGRWFAVVLVTHQAWNILHGKALHGQSSTRVV